MGDFKRNKSGGGKGGRGGRSFGGGRPSGGSRFGGGRGGRPGFGRGSDRLQMFKTVCSACGIPCEVPFKPSDTKPVYCKECFDKGGESKGGPRTADSYKETPRDSRNTRGDSRRDSFKDSYRAPNKDNSGDLKAINAKLDRIIKLLTEDDLMDEEDEEMKN